VVAVLQCRAWPSARARTIKRRCGSRLSDLPASPGHPFYTRLRGHTYTTLIGLLAATGLRPGEALMLDRSDVDLDDGILSIWESKCGRSYRVPIVPSTRDALQRYADRHDVLCAQPSSPAFLLSEGGRRVQGAAARDMFAKLTCEIGLRSVLPSRSSGAVGRACRICVTALQRVGSSSGTERVWISGARRRNSPPLGASRSASPIGTSKRSPSCWRSPPTCS
jgi:hypothetical protein